MSDIDHRKVVYMRYSVISTDTVVRKKNFSE